MKRYISYIAVFALLACGLFMPDAAGALSRARLEDSAVVYTTNDVSLTFGNNYNFFDTLFLFTECNAQLELREGDKLTAFTAGERCRELCAMLTGISEDAIPAPTLTRPYLLAREDSISTSAIYWMAVWTDEIYDESVVVWIDDESGLLVAYHGPLYYNRDDGIIITTMSTKQQAVILAEYYFRNTGVVDVSVSDTKDSSTVTLISDDEENTVCLIYVDRVSDNRIITVPHRPTVIEKSP